MEILYAGNLIHFNSLADQRKGLTWAVLVCLFAFLVPGVSLAQSDGVYNGGNQPALKVNKWEQDDIRPWIAVKSNLLFDAALAPNIEVERWFGKHNHWSAMAEVWFPWYTAKQNSRAYQILTIGAELRYWFFPHNGNLRPLHGQFVGLYAAGGKYDVEWKSDGSQGEFTSLGLTYGYAFRLGKRFNMELSVSGGYVGGPYRRYEGMFRDTHLIWQRTENLRYWGITKAKVSLVWLIGNKK